MSWEIPFLDDFFPKKVVVFSICLDRDPAPAAATGSSCWKEAQQLMPPNLVCFCPSHGAEAQGRAGAIPPRAGQKQQCIDVPAFPTGVTALITESRGHFFECSSPTGLNRFLLGRFKPNLADSALERMKTAHLGHHGGLDGAGTCSRWAGRLLTTRATGTGVV